MNSLKTIYSFIAPEPNLNDDIETLLLLQLVQNFDRATINYEFNINYNPLNKSNDFKIPINKFTNQKELYINTKNISNISDFYRLKEILIGLGFTEGCSL